MPSGVTPDAKNLLEQLMTKDPIKRLGSGKMGVKAVQAHPWFSGISWSLVAKKEVQPPWKPQLDSVIDFKYFDQYPDSGGIVETPSKQE